MNDRILEISKILLNSKKEVTVDSIAKQIRVSNKTVRNDLDKLQDIIEKLGLKLNKKSGTGISIQGPENLKLTLLEEVSEKSKYVEPYSPEDRKNYILKRLFIKKSTIAIQKIAEELYVSKVTIYNDLKYVEKWLEQFNLKLLSKPNHGIEIIGNEENCRDAIANLISKNKDYEELKELFYKDYNGRIDYNSLIKLTQFVDIDYSRLDKIIEETEEQLQYKFSDESYSCLVIHIAICIKRIKQGKDIKLPNDILENLKIKEEFSIAKDMALTIQKQFNIEIPEPEVGYILLHILGSKLKHDEKIELDFNFNAEENNDITMVMAKEIIAITEKVVNTKLSKDKYLLSGLILHLRPTINRLKYGLTIKNPLLGEIKENYPDLFGAAWIASTVFEKYLDVSIPEDEIGYIAVHIGAAVERNRTSLKTIIVCHTGIGTSQLLSARIKRCFKQIDIVDVTSSYDIKKRSLEDIDTVISTVPLEIDVPVLVVRALLTQNDIKKIENFINEIFEKKGIH